MVLKPPLVPTWLPGLSIARPPSNYPVQFRTIRWGFLFPRVSLFQTHQCLAHSLSFVKFHSTR